MMTDAVDSTRPAAGDASKRKKEKELGEDKIYPYGSVDIVGKALIVNNSNFKDKDKNLKGNWEQITRGGSQDAEKMRRMLKDELGFELIKDSNENEIHENMTKESLIYELGEAAKAINGEEKKIEYGCFLCIIMSYGKPGVIWCPGSDGESEDSQVEIKDIQSPFRGDKCKRLATKPKIFLILGSKDYKEVTLAEGGTPTLSGVKTTLRKIPRECNFITHFCEVPDTRCESDKSRWVNPYITALHDAFNEYIIAPKNQGGDLDLLKVLTRVNYKMSKDHSDYIPLVTSLLTKKFYYFRTKKDTPQA